MVTTSVTVGSGEARLIVCTPVPGMLKLMSSTPGAAFASLIAWRREPAPASAVVVTTKLANSTRGSTDSITAAGRTGASAIGGALRRCRDHGRMVRTELFTIYPLHSLVALGKNRGPAHPGKNGR